VDLIRQLLARLHKDRKALTNEALHTAVRVTYHWRIR
jgi:hypothetical protein